MTSENPMTREHHILLYNMSILLYRMHMLLYNIRHICHPPPIPKALFRCRRPHFLVYPLAMNGARFSSVLYANVCHSIKEP